MMPGYIDRIEISVQPGFCIAIVLALVLLPIPWVLGWLLAVALHEFGHVLGMRLLKIRINSMHIRCTGVYIGTEPMRPVQELIVAGMGPVFSMATLLLARWVPYAAICGMIQLVFNILPISGFDGGRILFVTLQLIFPAEVARSCMVAMQMLCLVALLYLGVRLHWGALVLLPLFAPRLRTGFTSFPCKRRKQIVQWSK